MNLSNRNTSRNLKKTVATLIVASVLGVSSSILAKESLYAKGQSQLDAKNWNEAQQTFNRILSQKKGKHDAALYWLSYAQFHNNQSQPALKTIAKLIKAHPKSSWIDDAQALRVEIKDRLGDSAEIDNDELKLYAINSLMNSSSEKTLPLLTKIIKGKSSIRIKKRAMFVLSQSGNPRAFELLAELAGNDKNETLQSYAIETLGISGSKKAMAFLVNVYSETSNETIKSKVLRGLMVANDSASLISISRSESNPDLKRRAIKLLGSMGHGKSLVGFYKEKGFKAFRKDLIHALAIGGSAERLFTLIETEKDDELKLYAVQKLGIVGGKKVSEELSKIYQANKSIDVRKAVVKALFIQSNSKALIALLKTEKQPAIKRDILKKLSIMGDDESVDYFANILDDEG
ncbi:MAG: HEAT repeat domain-containing protein [Kangiellaceae bacterium]|nr:HEAT repeat domain-containing protein [Kangiellaceae bacterium]